MKIHCVNYVFFQSYTHKIKSKNQTQGKYTMHYIQRCLMPYKTPIFKRREGGNR